MDATKQRIHISCISWIAGGFFTTEPPGKPAINTVDQTELFDQDCQLFQVRETVI